jgi:uncharacterized protein
VRIIAIEEHWASPGIEQALAARPEAERDPSLVFNTLGDHAQRLADLGADRIAGMDALGIDVAVLGVTPPGTQPLTAADAVPLCRDANDASAQAVATHPDRLGALATLPTSDPDASVAELERCTHHLGHVGAMVYGRTGTRPLDHPAFDELLGAAADLGQPIFIHPQIPPPAIRDASYRGFAPEVELGLATFGWGWHLEAGLAALRLVLAGTFDRHPRLQIILGHWGEMLLFWLDRVDSLSNVATHLERRVSDYVRDHIFITSSGMLEPHLLRHALDHTNIDRLLFSTDHPFAHVDAAAISRLLDSIPDATDRDRFAGRNAAQLLRIPPIPT